MGASGQNRPPAAGLTLSDKVVHAFEIIDHAPAATGPVLHDQLCQLIAKVVTGYR